MGDCLYQAILCHWGEPTLNRQLPEIVRIFHDAGIYTTLDTNMTLMTPDLAGQLSAAGLDAISASIDGVSQAAYAQYRIGGDVAKALDGLRHIVAQRQRLGRENPRLRWQFLVFPHNEHEVAEAETLATQIGVDVFSVFAGSGGQWTREAGFQPPKPPQRPAGLLCTDPWMYLAVDWDGAVHLCCRAFQAQHVVGHMDAQTLPEIFDNERFQLARRVIRDGRWHPRRRPHTLHRLQPRQAFLARHRAAWARTHPRLTPPARVQHPLGVSPPTSRVSSSPKKPGRANLWFAPRKVELSVAP